MILTSRPAKTKQFTAVLPTCKHQIYKIKTVTQLTELRICARILLKSPEMTSLVLNILRTFSSLRIIHKRDLRRRSCHLLSEGS